MDLNNPVLHYLQRELEGAPNNIRVLSELAKWFVNQADYSSACAYYETVVCIDPASSGAWIALGHCYLLKNDHQNCFAAYQRALCALGDKQDIQLWYGIALLYHKCENYDRAKAAYQTVLSLDTYFELKHEVVYQLGLLAQATGAHEDAISYFRDSLERDTRALTRKIEVLRRIGSSYEQLHRLGNAVTLYREALRLDKEDYKTMEYLGWALCLNGTPRNGALILKAALVHCTKSFAETGDLHYLLGRCHMQLQEFTEGQLAFQKAVCNNPDTMVYWCSLGILYAEVAQAQDAFNCLLRAAGLSPENGNIWFNIGVLYERCGQGTEAVLAYQRACSLDTKDQKALQRAKYIQMGEIPSFVHPSFEVAETPFSIKKTANARELPEFHVGRGQRVGLRPVVGSSEANASVVESGEESQTPHSELPARSPANRALPVAKKPVNEGSLAAFTPRLPLNMQTHDFYQLSNPVSSSMYQLPPVHNRGTPQPPYAQQPALSPYQMLNPLMLQWMLQMHLKGWQQNQERANSERDSAASEPPAGLGAAAQKRWRGHSEPVAK